jgi:drug/metabolite transporter (DMT)-like permease
LQGDACDDKITYNGFTTCTGYVPNLTINLMSIMDTTQTQSASILSRGYLICLVGVTFWSTTGILIRYLTVNFQLPALILAFWRDFFVAVALLLVLKIAGVKLLPSFQNHWKFLLLYGWMLSIFNAMWTFSVALNGAAISTVLVYSSPAFTAVLGWWIFREKVSWFKVGVIVFCLVGTILVSEAYTRAVWQVNLAGVITGLGSGLLFAVYGLFGKEAARRQINSWVNLAITFGTAAVFLLIYNLATSLAAGRPALPDLFWLGDSLSGWSILILLALVPTIAGYGLYTSSLNYLPTNVANLIATLEPVQTTILAMILLGEVMGFAQVLGSILILASVVALRIWEVRARPRPVFVK